MTNQEKLLLEEESQIDRANIAPYEPLVLQDLATRFIPKLSNKIPKFVFNWLNKILHLDDVNRIAEATHYSTGQQFMDFVCKDQDWKLDFQGPGLNELKSLTDKPVMFVSNHPYGGPEGIVAFRYIHRMFPRARLLIQSFLKFVRPFSEVCVFNKGNLHTLKKAVEEHRPLFFYPAGYCSRKLSNGNVFDYEWKSTFIKLAIKNNMPISVSFTEGSLSKRTLRITQIRKFFHIKSSIETALLPDEMFKLKGSTLKMTAGHIIDPKVFDSSVDIDEWAARVRQYCWELKTNPQAVFDPSKPATLTLV